MEQSPITRVHAERTAILDKKGHDYTANVNGVHVDNLKITGLPGIAVRLLDKATRAVALTLGGKDPKVVEESVRDTLLDAGNYADLGILLLDETYEEFRPATTRRSDVARSGRRGNPDGACDPDEEETPGEEDEGEENGSDEIVCFHSRNKFRILEENVKAVSEELWDKAICYNTGDITFNGAMTPAQILTAIRDIVISAKHVHVIWDGSDMFIPMIIGMATAWNIPVTSGHIDFPQGHPSRVHTLINSLPPLVE